MLQDTKSLWASCQKYISENVTPEDYDRLFSHVSLQTFKVATKTLVLQVPSSYICEEIENKYLDVMRVAIFNTFGKIRLDWSILLVEEQPGKGKGLIVEGNDETLAPDGSITAAKQNLKVAPGTAATNNLPPIDSQLNPSQTFRTFIEGNSNKLSRSVGLSIAEHPQSTQFNPMFIFGPSGCGKTHLVNAIGNHCRKMYPQKRVLYVSARIFQVQYSNAVMQKQINDFIAFYQTIDMLIVDDVQEWISAKGTQDTFFHIFNHLFRNNRRIILISDRAPVELEGMNKRLLTRFSCGLMAEMEKPNLQLCIDILKKKILRDGLKVPDDVVHYIAEKANGSVRDLEGVINSLMAYSVVYNCNIDMRLVERVVQRAVKTEDNTPLTVDEILDRVCRHYEVTPNSVKGRSRKREFLLPRQLTMFLAKKYTNIPASRIGRMIGGRDHSTVLHSIDLIEKRLKTDKEFAAEVAKIEDALKVKKEQ
ncbi:MAG: chromosomal replication initiator protein DnaA [Prevotella sp.]|nr:chromosomal replication initiator protein DnaA [Prevotella sp.]